MKKYMQPIMRTFSIRLEKVIAASGIQGTNVEGLGGGGSTSGSGITNGNAKVRFDVGGGDDDSSDDIW